MIKFKDVKISHFRNYIDAEVRFDYEKGIYIISGDNGAGKSQFVNAMLWCLYGDTPLGDDKSLPVSNENDSDDQVTTVEIWATIDECEYHFKRSTIGSGSKNGTLTVQYANSISDANWQTLNDIDSRDAVLRLIPREIRDLFFFNGEDLTELCGVVDEDGSNKESTEKLKSSVYKVSELDVVDNAEKSLNSLLNSYNKLIQSKSKNTSKIEELNNTISQHKIFIESCDKSISEYKSKVTNLQAQINTLDEQIKKTERGRGLLNEETRITAEIEKTNDEIDALLTRKRRAVSLNLAHSLMFDDLHDYYKVLVKARDEKRIPPPVDPAITQQILDEGICICGREITDKERALIHAQHEENRAREDLQFLTEGIPVFNSVRGTLPDAKREYLELLEAIDKQIDRRTKLSQDLKKVRDDISAQKIEKEDRLKNPELERTRLINEIQTMTVSMTQAGQEKVAHEVELDSAKKQLDMLLLVDNDVSELTKKAKATEQMIADVERLKVVMEESIRKKLAENTWNKFSTILTESRFKNIEIDSLYNVHLITKDDNSFTVRSLSTGQKKSLGLSLVYALSKDLGYKDVPLIIDSLYATISAEHYEEISRMIGTLAEDKQIIVMSLIDESHDEYMNAHVKQRYMIRDNKIEEVK